MKMSSSPSLILPDGFDEQALFELPFKGWLSAYVESEEGCRYPVYFSDPIRLQQDLDEEVQLGKPYFTMPGLIILPEVTMAAIEEAVQLLWARGFFVSLKAEQHEAHSLQHEYQFA